MNQDKQKATHVNGDTAMHPYFKVPGHLTPFRCQNIIKYFLLILMYAV